MSGSEAVHAPPTTLTGLVATGDIPNNRIARRVIQAMTKRQAGDKSPVLFYERAGYMLSNFSAHAIEFIVAGKRHFFMTSEHAYQAAKFTDQTIINKIGLARSPGEAKEIAHNHRAFYRADWCDEVKLRLMEAIFRAKAAQHQEVYDFLVSTNNRRLIENSPKDLFWGLGKNNGGKNHAGRIWAKIRSELQRRTKDS